MAKITTAGTMFPEDLVTEMFTKSSGRSSLAKLSASKPTGFNGNKVMTFSLDGEVSIVGEGEAKPAGEATVKPVIITPVKFVYQSRVSDEFLTASEDEQLEILSTFADGFAGKIARGLDIAAIHGVNPADAKTSDKVSGKSFTTLVTNTVNFTAATADDNIDDAVRLIHDNNGLISGIAMASEFSSSLSKIKANGVSLYPEFRFGANPDAFSGIPCDVNTTMSFTGVNECIVGDFANAFRWGYAKEVPLEVIPYGDPDGQGMDLKQYNQVCLRAEAYIGWGILDAKSFARIVKTA